MKNTVYLFLTLVITFFIFWNEANALKRSTYFVVTAYYSPLEDQEHYSYYTEKNRERTFEEEKILQWHWLRGASGKKVFVWMLAAPANYKFGSKIYLEWLGVWEVSDRWWAIVNKWNRWFKYDRIDVWMWKWDEWLRRAMYWGKRTVYGRFIDNSTELTLDYSHILPKKYTNSIDNDLTAKNFSSRIKEKYEFKEAQKMFIELWYYTGAIDWNYDKTTDLIYAFQKEKNIVNSVYSKWAGVYSSKTKSLLKEEYETFLIKTNNLFYWEFNLYWVDGGIGRVGAPEFYRGVLSQNRAYGSLHGSSCNSRVYRDILPMFLFC